MLQFTMFIPGEDSSLPFFFVKVETLQLLVVLANRTGAAKVAEDAGWEFPQKVVNNSKGILPKMALIQVGHWEAMSKVNSSIEQLVCQSRRGGSLGWRIKQAFM